MDARTAWRLSLVSAALLLICATGVSNAQKASPQNSAPKPAQPANLAKPQANAPPPAAGANEEEESGDEPPPIKAGTTAPKIVNSASPKPVTGQAPKALKSPEKHAVIKETASPAVEDEDNEGAAPAATNTSHPPVATKVAEKQTAKPTQPPADLEGSDDEAAEAPVSPSQPQKAPKIGENKAPRNISQPVTAAKTAQKVTAPPNDQDEADDQSGEVLPKISLSPKPATVGGKPLGKVTALPVAQNHPDSAEASPDDSEPSSLQPAAANISVPNLGGINKQNVTSDGSAKIAANGASPKSKAASPLPKEAPSDEGNEESGEDVAEEVTKKIEKATTPKAKGTSPKSPKKAASEEEGSEDGAASGDEPEPVPQPKKSTGPSVTTLAPNKQKLSSPPSGATKKPQISVNVPGGPSFQPLEGGAVPPVLARANQASAAAPKQPAVGVKGTTPSNRGLTTPAAKEEEEIEEGSGDDSSSDSLNTAIVSAVNSEYGSALKNLTRFGLLTEADYENRHLSDLFALLLENLVNANAGANENEQKALVHQAAVEFEEIFKAKAASTKNVSEIVRLLNEQIIAAPGGPAASAAPSIPSKVVPANGTSKGQPKVGAEFATPPVWIQSSPAPEEEGNGNESPQSINLQTLHLLQNADGKNKSIPILEAKNASLGEEKGNFPLPPAWQSTAVLPSSNTTDSGEIESAENVEAVNGTSKSVVVVAPPQNTSVAVPAPEPTPKASTPSDAGATNVSVPIAEPHPTAEPTSNANITSASPVSSEGSSATTPSESAESEEPLIISNVTAPAPAQQPSAGPSEAPSSSTKGSGTTEKASETASPEPSPSSSTPKSNVVLPWRFKIMDPQTEWDSELADKESFQFKALHGSLIADLKTIFKQLEPQRFIEVSIKQFSQGSVIVDGQTELKERVESGQLLENFLKVLKDQDNKIGGRIVDPASVTFDGRPSAELARSGSSSSGSTPAWVIGLSVGGVLLAAVFIAVALIVVRLIRNRRSGSVGSAIDSQTIKSSPLPTHVRPAPSQKRGSSTSSAGYEPPYATRSDYYQYYQPPYGAPGAVARTFVAPNYYSPYYQQHQGPYAQW